MPSIAKNTKANYEYEIKDTFDAGLALSGPEVKSAKAGSVSLSGSYIKVDAHGAYLINCHIGPYKYAPSEGYDPTHTRKLLLKKREVHSLLGGEKGLTIVPLEMYIGHRGLIKLKIGIGRGRKRQDKREYIKKKDVQREIRRETNR